MTSPWCLIALAALAAPGDAHEQANPLYRELRQTGVAVGPSARVKLPAPALADDLDGDAQEALLKRLVGEDYPLDEFVRASVVAPHLLRLGDASPSVPEAPSRSLDVFFVAFGNRKTATSREFLDRALQFNRKEGSSREIGADDLARRKMSLKPEAARNEGFAYTVFTLLDRVEIRATGHSHWSQTADSVLAAGQLDTRFREDAEFPNQWRPLLTDPDGVKKLGEPMPYDGAGYYVKVTRLARPEGALFVEGHLVFTEPKKWFDGANLLRSKLPPVVQDRVRAFRRELQKAAADR
jgi:hypothetical protein